MSDVDRLPDAGMVVDDLSERVATDGGEQVELGDGDSGGRPDECECAGLPGSRLPCLECWLHGFTTVADS